MDKAINESQNNKILVHCRAGASRSASLVIAFLMKKKKLSLIESYQFVLNKRPIIEPNMGFVIQLKQLEKDLL